MHPTKDNNITLNYDAVNASQAFMMMDYYGESLSEEEKLEYERIYKDPKIPSEENFQSQAKLLRLLSGNKIRSSQSLELLSKKYGIKDWNTMKTRLAPGIEREGQGEDEFLLKKVLPALKEWKTEHSSYNGIYPKEKQLAQLKLFEVLVVMMFRAPKVDSYYSALREIIESAPDIFSGYDVSEFHPDVQKEERWIWAKYFLESLIQKKIVVDYRKILKIIHETGHEKESKISSLNRITAMLNAAQPKIYHFITCIEELSLFKEDSIYALPLSKAVQLPIDTLKSIIVHHDSERREKYCVEQVGNILFPHPPFEIEYEDEEIPMKNGEVSS